MSPVLIARPRYVLYSYNVATLLSTYMCLPAYGPTNQQASAWDEPCPRLGFNAPTTRLTPDAQSLPLRSLHLHLPFQIHQFQQTLNRLMFHTTWTSENFITRAPRFFLHFLAMHMILREADTFLQLQTFKERQI